MKITILLLPHWHQDDLFEHFELLKLDFPPLFLGASPGLHCDSIASLCHPPGENLFLTVQIKIRNYKLESCSKNIQVGISYTLLFEAAATVKQSSR